MAQAAGVRVLGRDGTERTFPEGRSVTRDGNADFEIRDAAGGIIATKRRESVEEVEVVYLG
jgi:hypothetical protein